MTARKKKPPDGEVLKPELVKLEDADIDLEELEPGDIVEDDDGNLVVPIRSTHGGRELTSKERQRQALALRLAGASYDRIAETVGYANKQSAHAAVKRAMQSTLVGTAGDLRDVQFGRLEALLTRFWPDALKGDPGAAVVCMQIIDRIEKLFGLGLNPWTGDQEERAAGVLTIGGDKDNYVEGLRKARAQLKAVGE